MLDRTIAPHTQTVPEISLPPMLHETLPGGTMLYVLNSGNQPVNALTVLTRGGIAEASIPGLPGLVASMLNEGTTLFPGNQITDAFDFNGSWTKTSVNTHHISSTIYSLNSRFEKILPVFLSTIKSPTFPENAFTRQQNTIAQTLELKRQMPYIRASELSAGMAMGPHNPIAKPQTPQTIRGTSRADLINFHTRWFKPQNQSVYLSGKITPGLLQLVREAFSTTGTDSQPDNLNITPFSPVPPLSTENFEMQNSFQNAVDITLPAIPRSHPHYLPLHATVLALGGYFGSRLQLNIREDKGLTYGINASLLGYIDGAYTDICAQCSPQYVPQLIHEISAELTRLVTSPPEGDELRRLKQTAVAAMFDDIATPFSVAAYHMNTLTLGLPPQYFQKRLETIRSISPETISQMASLYLKPEHMRIAVAGVI